MNTQDIRQSHATLDLPSRDWKARKIERLLGLDGRPQSLKVLDVGTGSGGIAHYFAQRRQPRCDVTSADVRDNRLLRDGYTFLQVDGVQLPFEDASFDVVISNHVIEHVGDATAQCDHLRELRRVLKKDGVGYLAVPNRWMLIEPHYRLMFLSWWPHGWRTSYLQLMRKGNFYDCEPLQLGQMERMLDEAQLVYRNLCIDAWRATLEIERPQSLDRRLLDSVPDSLLLRLRRIIPTLIYRIERTSTA